MAVTITYDLVHNSAGGAGSVEGEADVVSYDDGYAYAGTDGADTFGFTGESFFFANSTGVDPSIALLSSGNLVVAGENASGVLFQIIQPDGTSVVNPTSISDAGSSNIDVAALMGAGGFVLVY